MILLVDVSGLAHRSAHKFQGFAAPDGTGTGLIYGVLRSLERLAEEFEPTELVLCWDRGHEARTKFYPEYKSNRKRDPVYYKEYRRQSEALFKILRSLPIINVYREGVEADDVIAVLSHYLSLRKQKTVVVTSDRDLLQLVGEYCSVHTFDCEPMARDVPTENFLAYKALVGDKSDNIPGVEGIGPKRAQALMIEVGGTIEALLDYAKGLHGIGKMDYEKVKETLERNVQLMTLDTSRSVSPLLKGVDRSSITSSYSLCRVLPLSIDIKAFRQHLMDLGMASILSRMSGFLLPFKPLANGAKIWGWAKTFKRGVRRIRRVVGYDE